MSNKRGHCPPTGNTPGKPNEKNQRKIERKPISSKKCLFTQNTVSIPFGCKSCTLLKLLNVLAYTVSRFMNNITCVAA
jgi:hypothetical protein